MAAKGDGSDVAMSGVGTWDPGAIGSRDGREVVVCFGSSGESGAVIGRPSSSHETSHGGGGEGGRWNSASASGKNAFLLLAGWVGGGGGGCVVAFGLEGGGCEGVSNAAGRGGCITLFHTR